MLGQRLWLRLLLAVCVAGGARAAVLEYSEPDMEADTGDLPATQPDGEKNGDSETEVMCKTSANCIMTETLKEMAELLKELNLEIKDLKEQVTTTCSSQDKPGQQQGEDKEEETSDSDNADDAGDGGEDEVQDNEGTEDDAEGTADEGAEKEETKCKNDKEEEEEEDMATGEEGEDGEKETLLPEATLPPPPESCPPPFQLLASSCYYIQTDAREWRSWGEAQSFCQQQSGTLAAPYRAQELREYLQLYYTSVFWVGGRYDAPDWVWLNGNKMTEDDWRSGMPSKHPSKLCVYLDYWNNYKGVSHFCGEKFSFICEYRQV